MADRLKRSLTFANVCSFLALFVAVSTGGAFAANTVFSTDIVDGEVKTEDIAVGAVTSQQLGLNSVNAARIINNSIAGDLADGAVTTDKVLDDTLTGADIGPNAVGSGEIADESITSSDIKPTPSTPPRSPTELDRRRRDHRQLTGQRRPRLEQRGHVGDHGRRRRHRRPRQQRDHQRQGRPNNTLTTADVKGPTRAAPWASGRAPSRTGAAATSRSRCRVPPSTRRS